MMMDSDSDLEVYHTSDGQSDLEGYHTSDGQSDLEGYHTSDGQSDLDKADTCQMSVRVRLLSRAHVEESDSADESARTSSRFDSPIDEVSI